MVRLLELVISRWAKAAFSGETRAYELPVESAATVSAGGVSLTMPAESVTTVVVGE